MKKKSWDFSKILLLVINILLLVLLGGAAYGVYNYKLSKDGEIARLNEIITLTEENNVIIPINDFKEYATRYGSMAQFSQRYFPEDLVYIGYEGIKFRPVDLNLPQNPLNDNTKMTYENRRAYYQDGGYTSLLGIDVSEYQGYINWKKVKNDGIDFAFIRVGYRGYSEGQIYLDGQFHNNMRGAQNAKVAIGVYFFSGAINEKEARAEADYVIRHIKNYKVTLPIAFDMEDVSASKNRMKKLTVEERTAITKAFCDRLEEKGYQGMVYGNGKWLMERLNYGEIANYGIWYANWDYFYWPYKVGVYQYSSEGKVDGIAGRVDMNVGFFNYDN